MKVIFFILTAYILAGCGGSAVVSGETTAVSRTVGSQLFVKKFKTSYYVGEVYDKTVKAVDEYGADVSNRVRVTGDVDTSKEGEYRVVLELLNSSGTVLDRVEEVVTVTLNQTPEIKLYGDNPFYLYLNTRYNEPGYEAADNEDGVLTQKVTVSDDIDNSTEGIYFVIYRVTDSFGNEAEAKREVHVIPKDDIRLEVTQKDTDISKSFVLWEYLVDREDKTLTYTHYVNNLKVNTQQNKIEESNDNRYLLALPYTLRKLEYLREENGFSILFRQESDVLKSVQLKERVGKGDVITLKEPLDTEKSCRLSEHYVQVKLADVLYDDVIKITCGKSEAYFAKGKGLLLENRLEAEDPVLSQSYLKSVVQSLRIKTITQSAKTPLDLLNLESMKQSHSDMLASEPYNLHGEGIKVGIADEGSVRATHKELVGRVDNITTVDISSHSTHLAGTIAATGINPDARGYANKAMLKVLSYNEDYMAFSYAIDAFRTRDIFISNHSYGLAEAIRLGEYGDIAHSTDKIVATHNDVLAIVAAGNDRGKEGYGEYGIIKDFGNAKNVITVGAVDYDGKLTSFSSTGPVSNGRVKPDIVAKGLYVYSLDWRSDDGYLNMSGTSMATPAVTGAVALLQERYVQVNNERMREDFVKALLANTAEDLGRKGPDYEYGFGLLNSLEAVKVIDTMETNASLVQLQKIAPEQKESFDLHVDKLTTFKATLSWIDPVSGFVAVADLINDLDITIMDKDYNVIYAYSLDPDNPEVLATQDGFNRVDNVEQIVATLPAGDYKVIVTVHKMQTESQKYALVSNLPLSNMQTDSSYSKIHEFETLIYESVKE